MAIFERYQDWVRSHHGLLTVAEEGLSSLLWFLPDRFGGSELTVEAVNALIGLLSLHHRLIVSKATASSPAGRLALWLEAIRQVEVVVELAAITSDKKRIVNKYGVLAALEAVKAVLRLLLLRNVGEWLLSSGGVAADEFQHCPKQHGSQRASQLRAQAIYAAFVRFAKQKPPVSASKSTPAKAGSTQPDITPATEAVKPSYAAVAAASPTEAEAGPSDSKVAEAEALLTEEPFWWDLPLAQMRTAAQATKPSSAPSTSGKSRTKCATATAGSIFWEGGPLARLEAALYKGVGLEALVGAGELLHTLRPLAYVLALSRYRYRDRPSWRPWNLSFAMDCASVYLMTLGPRSACAAAAIAAKQPAVAHSSAALLLSLQAFQWSPVEQRELARRRLLFAYYLLRSPFFEKYTGPTLRTGQSWMRPIPLLGTLADKAADLVFGVQSYYTYTSAS